MDRLRRDPRHNGFEVRDEQLATGRLFSGWSMKFARVRSSLPFARDDVLETLPAAMPDAIRERISAMVDIISEEVEL